MKLPRTAVILGVDASVAGFHAVPRARLERALGRAAWVVWQVLSTRRARDGLTHVTLNGIATAKGFEVLRLSHVRKALARLSDAGLVKTRGWVSMTVPVSGGRFRVRKVFARTVYGAITRTADDELVAVPETVVDWLEGATFWGGAREGAGRPKDRDADRAAMRILRAIIWAKLKRRGWRGSLSGAGVDLVAIHAAIGPRPTAAHTLTLAEPLAAFDLRDPVQGRTAWRPENLRWEEGNGVSCGADLPPPRRAPRNKQSSGAVTGSRGTNPPGGNALSSGAPNIVSLSTHVPEQYRIPKGKARAGGSGASVQILETVDGLVGAATQTPLGRAVPLRGVPPYPGVSLVAPCTVPEPPLLGAGDPEPHRVRVLAAAFRGVVEHLLGERTYLLARVKEGSPAYRTLAQAASALVGYGVSPVAWCYAQVRRWQLARMHDEGFDRATQKVRPPPIGVVFSSKAIEERLGDEERRSTVVGCVAGGRTIFGPAHKALLARYQEMRTTIMLGASPASATAKFFPGSAFDEMVDAARTEAVETRRRLVASAARGRFIW